MPGFTLLKGQAASGWLSGILGGLRPENYCSLHNRAGKLPAPHVLGRNREDLLLAFSGLPNYCSLHNRPGKRPTALVVSQNREACFRFFQESQLIS